MAPMFSFLFNTYCGWAPLVITECQELLYSKEGVTQGDPLSMFIHAIGTLSLIWSLGQPGEGSQVWYAGDASAYAPLNDLRDWYIKLLNTGPTIVYYPEPSKRCLVVNKDHVLEAHQLFNPIGVRIVTSHRLLGEVIGDPGGVDS